MSYPKVAILVSGLGSNMEQLLQLQEQQKLNIDPVVISSNADALAIDKARQKNIPVICLPSKEYKTRALYDLHLDEILQSLNPKLVILAGFMRILCKSFTDKWKQKLINIHPSLLPKYKGLNTHNRIITDCKSDINTKGSLPDTFHGSSVHYVTEALDAGEVITQVKFKLNESDLDCKYLEDKVKGFEHQLLPVTVHKILHNDATEFCSYTPQQLALDYTTKFK